MPKELVLVVVQSLCVVAAGYLLWLLWRRVSDSGRTIAWIVGGGFVVRAFGAIFLFWVSYLQLPFAPHLQDGDGYWKLASDAKLYMSHADRMLGGELGTFLAPRPGVPSPFYVQLLAASGTLFGLTIVTAVLVNLFAYLATALLIIDAGGTRRKAVLVSLAAISLAPGPIVWAVQPLKDQVFLFLVTAFLVVALRWQEWWRSGGARTRLLLLTTILLAALYAIAGVRWYFAVVVWIAALPFLVVVTLSARRRLAAAVSGIVLFVLMAQVIVAGSGAYLPRPIADALMARPEALASAGVLARDTNQHLGDIRSGFERSGGASAIRVGHRMEAIEEVSRDDGRVAENATPAHRAAPRASTAATPPPAVSSVSEPPAATVATEPPAATVATEPPRDTRPPHASAKPPDSGVAREAAAADREDPPVAVSTSDTAETPAAAVKTAAPPPTSAPARASASAPAATPAESETLPPPPSRATPVDAQPAVTRRDAPSQPEQVASAPTVTQPRDAPAPQSVSRETSPSQSPVVAMTRETAPAKSESDPVAPIMPEPPAVPAPVHVRERDDPGAVDRPMPSSTPARLLSGLAAAILPRFVNHFLGLVQIGGGQGLWLIAELDTLIFAAVLLFALGTLFRGIRFGALRSAAVWLGSITTFTMLAVLAYTISNYGTLFRHRSMILIGLCVIIVLVAASRSRTEPEADATTREG